MPKNDPSLRSRTSFIHMQVTKRQVMIEDHLKRGAQRVWYLPQIQVVVTKIIALAGECK
jgi:uncharacterized membrane protein